MGGRDGGEREGGREGSSISYKTVFNPLWVLTLPTAMYIYMYILTIRTPKDHQSAVVP